MCHVYVTYKCHVFITHTSVNVAISHNKHKHTIAAAFLILFTNLFYDSLFPKCTIYEAKIRYVWVFRFC